MQRVVLLTLATAFCVWVLYRILDASGGVTAVLRGLWRFLGLGRDSDAPARPSRAAERAAHSRQRRDDALLGLSIPQAAERAEPVLADARKWRCGGLLEEPLPFAPGEATRALFERWARIESVTGLAVLSLADARPYELPSTDVLSFGQRAARSERYWRVGSDFNECPLLMAPHSDTVHVVRRLTSASGKQYTIDYPSIYHWLIMQSADE